MTRLPLILLALLPSLARADQPPPDPADASDSLYAYRSAGVIRVALATPGESTLRIPRAWEWEGNGSTVSAEDSISGAVINWRIDIAGPGWLCLSLVSTPGTLAVRVHVEGRPDDDGRETRTTYAAPEDLARDEPGRLALALLARTTRGGLPDAAALAVVRYGATPPNDPAAASDCARAVDALDADAYSDREAASRKLRTPRLAAQLTSVLAGLKGRLTVEQAGRVRCLLAAYDAPGWVRGVILATTPAAKH